MLELVLGVSVTGTLDFVHPLPFPAVLLRESLHTLHSVEQLSPIVEDAIRSIIQTIASTHASHCVALDLPHSGDVLTLKGVPRSSSDMNLGVTVFGQLTRQSNVYVSPEPYGGPRSASHVGHTLASQVATGSLCETILRHVDCGVMLFGPRGEILTTNQAGLEILGIHTLDDLVETIARVRSDIVHDDGSPLSPEELPVSTALKRKEAVRGLLLGIHTVRSSKRTWVCVGTVPEFDSEGNVSYVVCCFTDVTARREALVSLKRETDLLREVMYASVAGIVVLEPTGNITYANRSAEVILGLTRSELLSRTYDSVAWRSTDLDGGPWPDEKQPFVRVMKTLAPVIGVQHAIELPDGRRRALSINGAPVLNAQGVVERLVFAILDITEQHAAESERRRLHAQMEEIVRFESLSILAGGVAHDFNNLLAGVLGSAGLALEMLEESHPVREHVQLVEVAARGAAELTKQLLAYSGRGRFVVRKLDTSTLLRQMDQLLRALVGRGVELQLDLPPNLPAIEADQTQIQQIVMNLVINAAEALHQRGVIQVRAGEIVLDAFTRNTYAMPGVSLAAGNHVFIEVQDDGPGIAPDILSRIFDPFFTTKERGHGLGLAAVLGIMKGHRGSVTVRSETGKGTTFRLTFPDAGEPTGTQRKTAQTGTLQLAGKILVVDDEAVVLTMLQRMVRKLGCESLGASNGIEGLQLFEKHHAELCAVLLDLSMPGMSGKAVFQAIRAIDPRMPVVLMSGFYEDDGAVPARDRHCVFVQKPFQSAAMIEELKSLLGRSA